MKKIVVLLMAAMLAAGMTACGGNTEGGASSETSSVASSEASSSASSVTSSEESDSEEKTIGGIITDASMNSITIQVDEGEAYTVSTVDADKEKCAGLEIGSAVWAYFSADGAAAVKLVQAPSVTVSGTIGEDSSMNSLEVVAEDGTKKNFSLVGADMTNAPEIKGGNAVTVTYSENTELDSVIVISVLPGGEK